MSYKIATVHEEHRGCDSVVPFELMPTIVQVGATLQVFRKPDDSPVLLGIAPAGVDNYTNQAPFAANRYIAIEFRDSVTDKTVLFLPQCMITDRSGSVNAEDLLVEVWKIMSIGITDALTQKALLGAGGLINSITSPF
jgi:hypothetical protein